MKLKTALLGIAFVLSPISLTAAQTNIQSRAEKTNYAETSRYADVMEFVQSLQRASGDVKVESFGVSNEGRSLPLVILANPSISSPLEAVRSGKPIVFIMANIHAGEVEGKEAAQHLMRDVVLGTLKPVLDKIILLVAPIYNADGNERIDINNRTAQNGPPGGVGVRENAQRLDLNRDFMKMESPEARGLITGVFNRWDPHVVIDLHTTNGSYHGYALTFSPALNPNSDKRLVSFARDRLLPDVSRTLRSKYKYKTYFYGNFAEERNPQRETAPDHSADPKVWASFDHRPRFGNNYVGLRNRIALLSEAYSYLDLRTRVDVTDKFVRTILQYTADHAAEVVDLVRQADRTAADTGKTAGNEEGFGIAFELKASPKPVQILVGSVTPHVDPRNNKPRLEANEQSRPVKMTEYGEFQATRRAIAPAAYILKPNQQKIVDVLLAHGIVVETTAADETLDVEQYAVKTVSHQQRAFQGHKETAITVTPGPGKEKFPRGSFLVTMHQPKAALVFYLLEPESDDGLVDWNFFDDQVDKASESGAAAIFPVYRLKTFPAVAREGLKR